MLIGSHSPEETFDAGKTLAQSGKVRPGSVITLGGDLGTGKTVFVKGFAEGLGIKEPVTSPTFTIMCEYRSGSMPLYHFDVYRIEDEDEMYEVGLPDYLCGDGVCIIEWAERVEGMLPDERLSITIEKDIARGADYRLIRFEERTAV